VSSLAADRRGAAYVEFLIVIIPFFMFVLCVLQGVLLQFADLAVDRAAIVATRSAVVVLDDDPQFYSGEARNSARTGGPRMAAIRQGAANVLASLSTEAIQDMDRRLSVGFPVQPGGNQMRSAGFAPDEAVTVRVGFDYSCGIPLAGRIVCGADATILLEAEASLPNQGARYSYAGGSR